MKWLFVRRSRYDEVAKDLAQTIDHLTEAAQENDALLERAVRAERSATNHAVEAKMALDLLSARESYHERQMVASETRFADLMASYRLLRLQGAQMPEPSPTAKPPIEIDPVIQAVNDKAPDGKTRTLMLRQVAIDRQAGIKDEEILLRIARGNRPGEELSS